MRALTFALALLSFPVVAFAVDLGRAAGSVTVDSTRIDLYYAYAVGNQKNEITRRSDEVKVVITNKPLADSVKLDEIDLSFPGDVLGLVVSITSDGKVSHVMVQHPIGTYDSGYVEDAHEYRFKSRRSEAGTVEGNVSSRRVKTNTMTFSFDVEFAATVK